MARQTENPPPGPQKGDYEIKTTACPYCVIGCGYEAHLWKEGDGSAAPPEDWKNLWMSPSWIGKVRTEGVERTAAIVPDPKCSVNCGNHSIRGGTVGNGLTFEQPKDKSKENDATRERLTTPLLRVADGSWAPMDWDEATNLVADLIDAATDGLTEPRHLGCKLYGYHSLENTFAASSLLFNVIGTGNVAWHDRPSIAGSSPGLKNATINTHAFSYEDLSDCDVVFLLGSNAYECQSVMFQQAIAGKKLVVMDPRRTITADYAEKTGGIHLQPNKLGADCLIVNAISRLVYEMYGSEEKEALEKLVPGDHVTDHQTKLSRKQETSKVERLRVTKHRTSSYVPEHLRNFKDFLVDLQGNDDFKPENVAATTGIPLDDLKAAAQLLVCRDLRSAILYEKGLIWGFNYANTAAVANLAILTFNFNAPNRHGKNESPTIDRRIPGLDRKRGFCGRLGGHQKGWARPPKKTQLQTVAAGRDSYFNPQTGETFPIENYQDYHLAGPEAYAPAKGRPRIKFGHKEAKSRLYPEDIMLFWVVGCNPAGDVPNAQRKWKKRIGARLQVGRPAKAKAGKEAAKKLLLKRVKQRAKGKPAGLVIIQQDIYPNYTSEFADILLPAAGHGEETFTRYNGERRLRLYEKFQDPPSYRDESGIEEQRCLPDWQIFKRIALALDDHISDKDCLALERRDGIEPFKSWDSTAAIFDYLASDGVSNRSRWLQGLAKFAESKGIAGHQALRELGTTGVQLPTSFQGGKLRGTKTLNYGERDDKKQEGPFFVDCRWEEVADYFDEIQPSKKGEIWLTNGRVNEAWNSMYSNIRNSYLSDRYPNDLPGTVLEVNPAWAQEQGFKNGSVVSVKGENGAFKAVIACQDSVPAGGGFALFSYPCSEKNDSTLRRKFTDHGYANNASDVFVDPTGPIAANKYASAMVKKVTKAPRNYEMPTTAQRNRAFGEDFTFPGGAAWAAREVLVSRGLPRVPILVRNPTGEIVMPGATHGPFWRSSHATRDAFVREPLLGQMPLVDPYFDPDQSLLIQILEGTSKLPRMPMRSTPLEQRWIDRLREWVDDRCPENRFEEVQTILDYSIRIHARHFGQKSESADILMLDPDYGTSILHSRAEFFLELVRVPEEGHSRMAWRGPTGNVLSEWTRRDVELLERHLHQRSIGAVRFEEVQRILREAVEGMTTTALHGNFWDRLDREAFVTHRVLFAGGEVPIIRRYDGANSPLVQALRGTGAFTKFRMPFGRDESVKEEDIRNIEAWIDDGCP